MRDIRLVGVLSVAIAIALPAQSPPPPALVITHATVIDGLAAEPLRDATVVIRDGKIERIVAGSISVPAGATVLDLKGRWLLPGFIDAHAHLRDLSSARSALASGVTTARVLGVDHFADIGIRELNHAGVSNVPDVLAAGYHVRPHPADALFLDVPQLADLMAEVRGPQNVRRMVRLLIERGADVIKIMATERAGLSETDPRKRVYSDEELAAAVDEARKLGRPVAAHAHGDEGAAAAVRPARGRQRAAGYRARGEQRSSGGESSVELNARDGGSAPFVDRGAAKVGPASRCAVDSGVRADNWLTTGTFVAMNCSVFIATSLDGFIARVNGDIDWLPQDADSTDEDYGYAEFMKSVDTLVMGRMTYEKVRSLGAWPYTKPVVVLASRKVEIPKELSKTVTTMSGNVDAIVSHLASLGNKHLYVDGGATIQKFLNAGEIHRLIITRVPVLLGQGLPLFGFLQKDILLKHVRTRQYPSGLVQSEYVVVGSTKRPSVKKARVSKVVKAKKGKKS